MKRREALGTFAVYKLIIFGLAFASIATVPKIWPSSLEHFSLLLYQWDARYILRVAREGYLAFEPSMQVFPVVPMLIRLFHLIIPSWEIAGIAVTQVASFFAFYYLYRLARLNQSTETSKVAVALFAFFPTAYFLTAPYTEATFCALSFAAVYYIRTEKYHWAGVAVCLAALTRYTGFLLGPAIFIQWVIYRKRYTSRQTLQLALVALCALLGFGVYLVLNKILHGDWFYYIQMQAKHWGLKLTWPLDGALSNWKSMSMRPPGDRMSIIIMEIGFMFAALGMLIPVYKEGRKQGQLLDFTYMALSLFLFSLMSFWLSRPRYVLPLYPMYLVSAPWFARSITRFSFYALGSIGLFGLYWALYLNAQWAH